MLCLLVGLGLKLPQDEFLCYRSSTLWAQFHLREMKGLRCRSQIKASDQRFVLWSLVFTEDARYLCQGVVLCSSPFIGLQQLRLIVLPVGRFSPQKNLSSADSSVDFLHCMSGQIWANISLANKNMGREGAPFTLDF